MNELNKAKFRPSDLHVKVRELYLAGRSKPEIAHEIGHSIQIVNALLKYYGIV